MGSASLGPGHGWACQWATDISVAWLSHLDARGSHSKVWQEVDTPVILLWSHSDMQGLPFMQISCNSNNHDNIRFVYTGFAAY